MSSPDATSNAAETADRRDAADAPDPADRRDAADAPDAPGTSRTPSVLFVCVKNGGKSQMAEALMRHRAGDAIAVHSAGTQPASTINALSAQVIAEVGADMSTGAPTPIGPELLARVDRVVVLGGEAQVDPVPGMRGTITTWHTDEPSERGIQGEERMRLVRDDVDARVAQLLEELVGEK